MALGQFLGDNGLELDVDGGEATRVMLAVAAGETDIADLTQWLRPHVRAEI